MINNLHIKNFKSLKEVDLELKNLNLLTGLNSTGKSSIIQLLRIIRKSNNDHKVLLRGKLGIPSETLLFSKKDEFKLQVDFEDNKSLTLISIRNVGGVISFSNNELHIKAIFKSVRDGKSSQLEFNARRNDANNHYYVQAQLGEKSLFNDKYQYLNTERLFLSEDSYNINTEIAIKQKMLGEKGEHTAFYLNVYGLEKKIEHAVLLHSKAESNYLLHQVNAWLSEISPNISVVTELEENKVRIFFKYGKLEVHPRDVGFGLSYILPVIVALLTAEKGKLIIIENPESHIHPRGQAELGRLLAAAAQTGAQLIVETHSDHILNGIRVAVKEKPEIKDTVAIFFHDRITDGEEQYTKITPIKIDQQGELSEYPDNFLDEWSNQLFKLV